MELSKTHWHSQPVSSLASGLNTDLSRGISEEEASIRLASHGKNKITARKKQSSLIRFLLQFNQPLIYILLAATVVTLFLEEYLDAVVIFAVVLVNSIIGFVQESKALKALDALSKSMGTSAKVIRDGVAAMINSEDLVPGDLVTFQAGDKIPADVRLISSKDLQIDESALTGESVATAKGINEVDIDTTLGDRHNMGFATTVVTYGTGKGVIVTTGDHTEVGKINQSIASAEELDTPLTLKIKSFSHTLLWVILAFSVVILVVSYLRGENLADAFMVAVALVVGAIPEGLPAAVTIMLALGVSKMAKRKAIIRKMVAVETLGSTDVICSDKTGTLTENQMTVQQIFAGGEIFDLTGIGYRPVGDIHFQDMKIDPKEKPALLQVLQGGVLCNDSRILEKDGIWIAEGDPTEAALLSSGEKGGLSASGTNVDFPRVDEIPFQSEYQYMATLNGQKGQLLYLKGSLESVLQACPLMLDHSGNKVEIDLGSIQEAAEKMASEGLRVLAFAYLESDQEKTAVSHEDVADGLVFTGLQGMIDPPRTEAIQAVGMCQDAGIQVKMITGDHATTAATIADQLGIRGKRKGDKLVAIAGRELQELSDEKIRLVAEEVSVFARVSPDQKLRLVKSLQANGHIVAMTGDGVNDGPALKQANIGVAMGITGTEVAKDASDMVLTDDNFASIEAAVEEGRAVVDNLTKFIVWTLPTNLGEGLVILASIVFVTSLPLSPIQILWINMATSVLLGLMLTFEPKEPGIMDRPPIPANKPILNYPLVMRTLLVGTIIMLAAFALFQYEISHGASLAEAQTVSSTVFVILESFYLFNCRSLRKSIGNIGWFSNKYIYLGTFGMLLCQLLFIYAPIMNRLFSTAPISFESWTRIIAAGLGLFAIVSIEKSIRSRVGGNVDF